jgi:hypothetical protein
MAKPTASPIEYQVLDAIKTALAAATGDAYYYDAEAAYVVDAISTKLLRECDAAKTLYLIAPLPNTSESTTGACGITVSASCNVTAAKPFGTPELPWETGHYPLSYVQTRLWHDVTHALNNKLIAADVVLNVEGFEYVRGVDGWCVIEVQIGYEFTDQTI